MVIDPYNGLQPRKKKKLSIFNKAIISSSKMVNIVWIIQVI